MTKMKDSITFNTKAFQDYLNTLIESVYELGILYEKCHPSFSKEESIKSIQNKHWKKWEELLKEE